MWKVVNWTYIDEWIAGSQSIRVADYSTTRSAFIHVAPISHSFAVVLKIEVVRRRIVLHLVGGKERKYMNNFVKDEETILEVPTMSGSPYV